MPSDKARKIILISLCAVTLLIAGWSAGAAYGYRSGYATADKVITAQQARMPAGSDVAAPYVRDYLRVISDTRHFLSVKFKGKPDRDFIALADAQQKSVRALCATYQEYAEDAKLKKLCDDLLLPTADRFGEEAGEYFDRTGLR